MSKPEYPKKIADNVTMYAADPIIYLVKDFLNDEECGAFIDAAQGKLKDSTVISDINTLLMKAEHHKTAGSNMILMKLFTK